MLRMYTASVGLQEPLGSRMPHEQTILRAVLQRNFPVLNGAFTVSSSQLVHIKKWMRWYKCCYQWFYKRCTVKTLSNGIFFWNFVGIKKHENLVYTVFLFILYHSSYWLYFTFSFYGVYHFINGVTYWLVTGISGLSCTCLVRFTWGLQWTHNEHLEFNGDWNIICTFKPWRQTVYFSWDPIVMTNLNPNIYEHRCKSESQLLF